MSKPLRKAITAGTILLAGAVTAAAQDMTGKTISLLVGTTTGGGYDVYARVLARHWGRHIPGNPNFVVKNMPGAGGLTMVNYLYNQAPRDGTEIATMQSGVIFEKLFQTLSPNGANARFKADKFGWIGSALRSTYVTVTWHDAPVRSIKDAQVKEAVLGASTTSSDNFLLAVLGNRLLGTKFRIVHGYQGSTATDLAIERGEINGAAGKDWTTLTTSRPDWLRDKKLNIIVQMGMEKHPALSDVPSALDLARSPADRTMMELVFAKFNLSRPFIGPPGMPPETLAMLRRSFDAVLKDPALLDEAAKAGMEIIPVSGTEAETLVARLLKTPDQEAQKLRALLQP
ncbi:MAG: tripartite tricarboxylate transporter family receptor [Hyphomicrobiales bacterium]|nr:tripartite tricarboxylate transporter family receptor [Hyphomicrobiales bacterium]